MAIGFGEGTGGGLTNASRAAGGGYGGIRSAASSSTKTSPTSDARYYDYKNQHAATFNALTKPAQSSSASSASSGLGFDKQLENDMINKATEEISVGQDEAKRSATERAAALGFSRSGGTEEAMQRIDSAAAGDKAAAARDARIASANLGFQREMASSGSSSSGASSPSPLDSLKSQSSAATIRAANGNPAAGGPKIIGGGVGDLKPLKGGGFENKNGEKVGNARPTKGRNSESSTF